MDMIENNKTSDKGAIDKGGQGPKYWLDIEGDLKPWDQDTITAEEIIRLGGWDPSQGAMIIDAENNERTLTAGEVVEIKPGMGFAKKVRFRRGGLDG